MPNSGRENDDDSNNTAQADKSPLKPKNSGPSERKAEIEEEEPEEKAPAGGDDDIYWTDLICAKNADYKKRTPEKGGYRQG